MIIPLKNSHWLLAGILIFSVFISEYANAERYRGSLDDKTEIQKVIRSLNTYKDKFKNLLGMQDRIENWKIELDKEHSRIGREIKLLESDKQLLKQGKMTEVAMRSKWVIPDRKNKIEKDEKIFQVNAENFNQHVRSYNELAMELAAPLQKRTPKDVRLLVVELGGLILKLEKALANGNIRMANEMVKQSSIVSEFIRK